MMDKKRMESNLHEEISRHWQTLRESLEKSPICPSEIDKAIEEDNFMNFFNDFLVNTKPQFDIPLSDLGRIYRGVGINEEIALDNYSRMVPDPERVKGHNRTNPPGEAFIYLAVIPQRKSRGNKIEKNFILKTIESELRVRFGDFYTVAQFTSNSDNPIFDMSGDPRVGLDLDKIAKKMIRKSANIEKLTAQTYVMIFNNEGIFKPINSDAQEYRSREYAPFQLLAKHFQSKGYANIKYRSTMHHGGTNALIFKNLRKWKKLIDNNYYNCSID